MIDVFLRQNHFMQRILLIDNYDSFTYNLVQLLRESGIKHELLIVPNDTALYELPEAFDKVLISPGPGLPDESGHLMQMISSFVKKVPVLGVCLGHQALCLYFGAGLKQLPQSIHGQKEAVYCIKENELLFDGLRNTFFCGRYHSWVVDPENLPECIITTATDQNGNIMAMKHANLPVWGVQFHPESYMTEGGNEMVKNWLQL
jgi:anthranilate synthase component II